MIVWALFDSGNGCYTQGAELLSICVNTQKLVLLIVFQLKMANAFAQKKMLKNGLIL